MEAARQDVLQESPKELDARQSHRSPDAVAAVLPAERYVGKLNPVSRTPTR